MTTFLSLSSLSLSGWGIIVKGYTKEHEWVDSPDKKTATIGITSHAQSQLGEIVFIELPKAGDKFDLGGKRVVAPPPPIVLRDSLKKKRSSFSLSLSPLPLDLIEM